MKFPLRLNSSDVSLLALPKNAVARLGRGCEPDIAFTQNGRYLAVGTWVGLWVYDLITLSPIALWEVERGMIGKVTFSPNGEWLAASNSDNSLKVWNVRRAHLTENG